MIAIHEQYRDYEPPRWVRPSIERLLASVPEHLGGVESIVLTSSAAMEKGKTQRIAGRKYHTRDCRGFYHPAGKQGRAWIEIAVDNVIGTLSPPFNFLRDLVLGKTLFHEIGHHLEVTVGAPARTGEAAADEWSKRLMRVHLRKRYWWLRPLMRVLKPVVRAFRR